MSWCRTMAPITMYHLHFLLTIRELLPLLKSLRIPLHWAMLEIIQKEKPLRTFSIHQRTKIERLIRSLIQKWYLKFKLKSTHQWLLLTGFQMTILEDRYSSNQTHQSSELSQVLVATLGWKMQVELVFTPPKTHIQKRLWAKVVWARILVLMKF